MGIVPSLARVGEAPVELVSFQPCSRLHEPSPSQLTQQMPSPLLLENVYSSARRVFEALSSPVHGKVGVEPKAQEDVVQELWRGAGRVVVRVAA